MTAAESLLPLFKHGTDNPDHVVVIVSGPDGLEASCSVGCFDEYPDCTPDSACREHAEAHWADEDDHS